VAIIEKIEKSLSTRSLLEYMGICGWNSPVDRVNLFILIVIIIM